MKRLAIAGTLAALCGAVLSAQSADTVESGRKQFNTRCAGCHGADGFGGERAPAIGAVDRNRLQTDSSIQDVIRKGIPNTGMPGFDLPDAETAQLVAFVKSRVQPLKDTVLAGDRKSGEALFFGNAGCSGCHMIRGRGGFNGPDLTEASRALTLAEIETVLNKPDARRTSGYEVATVKLKSGRTVRGFVRNESAFDIQIQGLDRKLYLLTRSDVTSIDREAKSLMPPFHGTPEQARDLIAFIAQPGSAAGTPEELPDAIRWNRVTDPKPGEWPTYHGKLTGNRYVELDRITPANVSRLAPRWTFPVHEGRSLELTPVVVDGVMYVTSANTVYAVDARSGRQIWEYSRPRAKKLVGDASSGINRGVAVLGDRVFIVTDNAHLIAIHRLTGGLLWDTEMADASQNYGATSAPLVAGDLVLSGVSGGDEGVRGFLSAYKADTGERVWRFWTIPAPGDPEASTWVGRALEHGCGTAWLTGTYDSTTDTLFWPVGNPCPDYNGKERMGDNLYTDSVLALDSKNGKLKWYYQFTPHDLHDWDATETPMLVDAEYEGRPRKLLLQGNRNGFFYVLDRENGKLLRATPFVKKLTWAKGIDKNGRPELSDAWEPTEQGTLVCPSVEGASNWMSTSYNPKTGLFYLMALEKCNIYTRNAEWWKQGESFYGGTTRQAPEEAPRKFLRAIDLTTGKIAWEFEQPGPAESWGGVLSTSSGLVFFASEDGAFAAADARTGKPLWHFQMNAHWHASPMSYAIDGKQYIAIAAGSSVVVFGLAGE